MARISLNCHDSLPGFPLRVISVPMENKYKCQQCLQVLRNPVQARCGHRFCVHCFKQLTSSGPKPCETCRQEGIYKEPCSILKGNEAFPDNAAGREIASLPVRCSNEDCSWTGSVKEYESHHEGRCEYERVQCEACYVSILRTDTERHLERECKARTLNCKYCKMTFAFKDIKAHDEICVKFPLQCKDCGKKKIHREKFGDHSKSCAKSRSACPFSELGCKFVIENGKLSDHELSSTMEHLRLMMASVLSLSRARVEDPGPGERQEDSGPDLYRAPEEGASLGRGAAASESSEDIEKKVSALENIVCVLNREVEQSSVTLEAFSQQHRLNQETLENQGNKVHQLERTLTLRDLAGTDQLLRELQFCTYDGVFVWKIGDVKRQKQNAVEGRTPSIFSPDFYSSKYGYKMCLRLYLNGDGTGRGTHLSLFLSVKKGNCDALLKWPFNQKVTLMLLDQTNREHIIEAFRPDDTSVSFQRPTSERNVATGCPQFCPLAKLTSKSLYLREDTIFIKAIVDLTGL